MSGEAPSTSSSQICGICENKVSRYCCPRCEVFYCSLDCYKSEKHNQCSENFYRECVQEELASHHTDDESRKRMVEILKRMNVTDAGESSDLDNILENIENLEAQFSDSDDEQTLALHERIKDLNLEDPDAVWEALNEDERNEFEAVLSRGEVDSFIPLWEPWWAYNDDYKPVQELSKAEEEAEAALKRCPALKTVPKLESLTKVQPSSAIKFNLTNVIASYAFIIRYFNGDLDPVETTACLLNICANLDGNANFDDPEMALESVAQRCMQSELIQTDEPSLDVMTKDTFLIIQGPNKEKQTYYCQAALSHLHKLFTDAKLILKNPDSFEIPLPKGMFSRKFPEHKSEHLPKLDVGKVKKCIKKVEYYLSYVENYGMVFE